MMIHIKYKNVLSPNFLVFYSHDPLFHTLYLTNAWIDWSVSSLLQAQQFSLPLSTACLMEESKLTLSPTPTTQFCWCLVHTLSAIESEMNTQHTSRRVPNKYVNFCLCTKSLFDYLFVVMQYKEWKRAMIFHGGWLRQITVIVKSKAKACYAPSTN